MNQSLTVTPRRSRVRPLHLATHLAAIPALRLLGTCAATVLPRTLTWARRRQAGVLPVGPYVWNDSSHFKEP